MHRTAMLPSLLGIPLQSTPHSAHLGEGGVRHVQPLNGDPLQRRIIQDHDSIRMLKMRGGGGDEGRG